MDALFALPFPQLIFRAAQVHRANFNPCEVQISILLSIKTSGCPEDCTYCPQTAHYASGVQAEKLMSLDAVLSEARVAKASGAQRFYMGAAWRSPKERDLDQVCVMIASVKTFGLGTCATLGIPTPEQARLKSAGLDYYNHNLDTSSEFYSAIIATRNYQDQRTTLKYVRDAGIHVRCCGIVGMGETLEDRAGMIAMLASLPVHPESLAINMLMRIQGTPLAKAPRLDPFDFLRTIAVARKSEECQALCFLAGANSIFDGPKLLTTPNPGRDRDMALLDRLGLRPMG